MIGQRTIYASQGVTKLIVNTFWGLPQGGVISRTMWALVADSLLKWLSKQGFADDGTVLIIGAFLSTICEIMQRVLHGIEKWCDERQLSVNPSKTELILFTIKLKIEGFQSITFYGKTLALSNQVKYLGVLLDSKLSRKNHVEAKCNKYVLAAFYQVRRAVGTTWLYTAVIRPIIAYAAVVWWPRVTYSTVAKQLEHIQRFACLYITGAIKTTPTAAMELITGLVPLPVFIKQEAMAFCYRLRVSSQWYQNGCGHTTIKCIMARQIPESLFPSDSAIIAKYYFDKNYGVHIPERDDWHNNNVLLNDDIVCFTDGSRLTQVGSSGSGVSIINSQEEYCFPLGYYCTVYQAEIYAILACAQLCRMREEYGASVAICSDSQAALKSLSSAKVTFALVAQTVEELQLLSMHSNLGLLWVPGHCGFEGNEKSDLLAKQASVSNFTGPEPVFGLSITTLRTNLRKWALKEQRISWQQNPRCRQTKLYINEPNPGLAKFALSLRKQDLRLLTDYLLDMSLLTDISQS